MPVPRDNVDALFQSAANLLMQQRYREAVERGYAEPDPRDDLSGMEVLRMPAGSNPSYLTAEEVNQLRAGWPQVQDR